MTRHASLPGFRDFYPADFAVRTHITNAWREAARRHGFEEYDGPPLEALELYTEKSGDEIVGQLYAFEDRGGRMVALRPEMTPTLARMVGARAGALRKPIRWFSMPQLFRYERTQRGRLREHFQWNVDILGEDDITADAEVLSTGLDALHLLGLGTGDVVARFNDRRLLESLLLHVGVRTDQLGPTYAAVDKLAREPHEKITERLREAGLDAAMADAVLGLFDDAAFEAVEHRFGRDATIKGALERLAFYRDALADLGHAESIRFDLTIVRGLAYYTGIVFEIFDRAGELRAICGGGRYDRLLSAVSEADLPAVGFGMGDVVLTELLRDRGLLPDHAPGVDDYVIAVSESERSVQRRIATALRAGGRSVAYGLKPAGVAKQFKDANARGAARAIVIGPAEVAAGIVIVREMATGEERRIPIDEIAGAP
ncbi:MAG: histidine--tRNA ligase [Longimicrobiales bacterium]